MSTHFIFKVAFRNVWKNKQQTFICLFGLVVGIICFSLCSYFIRILMESDSNTSFSTARQIHSVHFENEEKEYFGYITFGLGKEIEQMDLPGIEAVGRYMRSTKEYLFTPEKTEGKEIIEQLSTLLIGKGFFNVFPVKWIIPPSGDGYDRHGNIVISRSAARLFFGNENPVGYTLESFSLEDTEERGLYTICGVIEDFPKSNSISPFQPIDIFLYADERFDQQPAKVKLISNIHISTDELNKRFREDPSYRIPLTDGKLFYPVVTNDYLRINNWQNRLITAIVLGISFLVLLAGLINFFSITIGNFYNRTKELSLRKELGAGKREIFLLLFTETSLVVLLAFILSFPVMELFLPFFRMQFLSTNPIQIYSGTLYLQQLQYLPLILGITGLMACVTTYRVYRLEIVKGIKGGTKTGRSHIFRNCMLGLQLFISILFLGTGVCFYGQFAKTSHTIFAGMSKAEKQRIYEIKLDFPQVKENKELIINRLLQTKSITDILQSSHSLINDVYRVLEETDKPKIWSVKFIKFSSNFGSFLNLPLIQGGFNYEPQHVVVNHKLWDALNNTGRFTDIFLDNIHYKVTGVVELYTSVYMDDGLMYGVLDAGELPDYLYVRSRPGEERDTYQTINRLIREWVPETVPYEIQTLNKVLDKDIWGEQAMVAILMWFAALCLLITSLGIYSAITVDTVYRQKEVAIRKINGGLLKDIIWLFGKLYFRLLILSALFAIPVAWLITKSFLEHFPSIFNYNNPLIWLGIVIVISIIIGITIGYRLFLIARMNPVQAIRRE